MLGQRSRHRTEVCASGEMGTPGDPSRQTTSSAPSYTREGAPPHTFCTELAGTQSSVTTPLKPERVYMGPPGKGLGDRGLQQWRTRVSECHGPDKQCLWSSAMAGQRQPWTIHTQLSVAGFQYYRTYRNSLGAGFGPKARVCKVLIRSMVYGLHPWRAWHPPDSQATSPGRSDLVGLGWGSYPLEGF